MANCMLRYCLRHSRLRHTLQSHDSQCLLQHVVTKVSGPRIFKASYSHVARKCWTDRHSSFTVHMLGRRHVRLLPVSIAAGVRQNSSSVAGEAAATAAAGAADLSGYIPPVPPVPEVSSSLAEMAQALNALGEPTLQSMGLGSFWPPGLVQQGLELLHAGLGLPWWASIVAGTIIVRVCMFPLVVRSQRITIHMMNHMPTIQKLQLKFSQARQRGNVLEAVKYGGELSDYMTRNNVKPFGQMIMPLCQLPIFISVFVGLRAMANLPVESMTTGGILWFTDLTMVEPIYGLPLLTALTFWATIEMGVDGFSVQSQTHVLKWIFRAMPLVMLPFIWKFPAAMLVYWFSSNTFSLIQVSFLKIPAVRAFFNLPEKVKQQIEPTQQKGFLEGFKEAYSNMKASQLVSERQRLDETANRKASHGPLIKTYPVNPKMLELKPKPSPVEIKQSDGSNR